MASKNEVRDLVERVVMGLRLWPDVRKHVRAGVEGHVEPGELAERLVAGMPAAWAAMADYGGVEVHLGWTLITPKLMDLDVALQDFPAALEQLHPALREDARVAWMAAVEPALRDLAGALRGAAEGDPVDRRALDEALARIPVDPGSAALLVQKTPRLDAAWATFRAPPPRPPEPPPPPGPDPIPLVAGMLKNAFKLFSGVMGARMGGVDDPLRDTLGRMEQDVDAAAKGDASRASGLVGMAQRIAEGLNQRARNARSLEPLVVLPGPIARLHVERDAVIAVLDDGSAHRVGLSDGAVTAATAPPDGGPDDVLDAMPDAEGPIVDAATLPDGRIAAVGVDKYGGFVVIGDPSTREWDDRDGWESALLAVVPRGDKLLCGAADGEVVVFRTDELEAIGGTDVSRPDDRTATLMRRGEAVEIPRSAIRAVAWLSDEQVVAGTQAGGLYVAELAWADYDDDDDDDDE